MRIASILILLLCVGISFAESLSEPLVSASEKGDLAKVKELIQKGASANSKLNSGMTALMYACKGGHSEVVKYLLNQGAEVNSKENKYGQTPLIFAVLKGDAEIVKALLDKGADVAAKESVYGQDALTLATNAGHEEIIGLLKKAGAKSNDKSVSEEITLSLEEQLIVAIKKGDATAVKGLLEKGADPNACDSNNMTAISLAARGGHADIVALLRQTEVKTAQSAGSSDAETSVERTPEEQKTLNDSLVTAVEKGDRKAVEDLLKKGADAKISNQKGLSLLLLASKKNRTEIAKLLLEKGADPNFKDSFGQTPLIEAASGGDLVLVKALIEKGADVNAKNVNGGTALYGATSKENKEIIELLKNAGAKE